MNLWQSHRPKWVVRMRIGVVVMRGRNIVRMRARICIKCDQRRRAANEKRVRLMMMVMMVPV